VQEAGGRLADKQAALEQHNADLQEEVLELHDKIDALEDKLADMKFQQANVEYEGVVSMLKDTIQQGTTDFDWAQGVARRMVHRRHGAAMQVALDSGQIGMQLECQARRVAGNLEMFKESVAKKQPIHPNQLVMADSEYCALSWFMHKYSSLHRDPGM
jgi:predicted  nucleic acid-binding Zn-ribbon protein